MNYLKTILILLSLLFILSCKDTPELEIHEHTFSKEWNNDDRYHWHKCTCGHSLIVDFGEHIFDEGVILEAQGSTKIIKYTCTICGYKKTVNKYSDIIIYLNATQTYVSDNNFDWCKSEPIKIECRSCKDIKGLMFYYTTDGTEPTRESLVLRPTENTAFANLYIEEPCTLKIFAMKDGEATDVETYEITAVYDQLPKITIKTENNCRYLGAGETVTIESSLDGVPIYYTLDGTIPTTSSLKYTGPFKIYENCTVYARAIISEYVKSGDSYRAKDTMGPGNLRNVSVDHISDTSVEITWENPVDEDYQKCSFNVNGRTIELDKTVTSCIINDLIPYEKNEVYIKKYDVLGNCSQNYITIYSFKPAMPTQKGKVCIPGNYGLLYSSIVVKKSDTDERTIELNLYSSTYTGVEFLWYQSEDNLNWTEIENIRPTDYSISIKIQDGIKYYCAGIKDGDTITYTNSCKIECNTPASEKIGKLYYADGTIDDEFISDKQILGIVCNVYSDGSIKNVLGLTEENKIKFGYGLDSEAKAQSKIDGLRNTNNLMTIENYDTDLRALAFCIENRENERWFIPSVQEMQEALCNYHVIDDVLNKLSEYGIEIDLLEKAEADYYWTSSVCDFYSYTFWYSIFLNNSHIVANHDNSSSLRTLRLLYRVN